MLGGWIAEKIGRIKVISLGSIVGVIGAGLQCSAQNSDWMICGREKENVSGKTVCTMLKTSTARTLNGIGTGMLNVIVPVWVRHGSARKLPSISF